MGANGFFRPFHGGSKQHVYVEKKLYSLEIDIYARSNNSNDFAFEIGLLFRTAVIRFAGCCCRYAQSKGDKKVTLVDKVNVITRNYGMQRQIFKEKARECGLDPEFMFVDAMAMIVRPEIFGTVTVLNLFVDILTDLEAQLQYGLGMGRSRNINYEGGVSMFEPIHGFAPYIAGRGIANLISVVLAT